MSFAADSPLWPLLAAALAAGGWWLVATRWPTLSAAIAPTATSVRRLPVLRIVMAAAVGLVALRLSDRPTLAVLVVVVWLGANALLRARRNNRLALQEETHAIEAIGAASRALRAGIPVGGMLEFLATESRGEAGRAFREIVHREGVGEELSSTLRRVLLVSPLPPLRAFGLTILSQLGSGGDIADTTDRLARALLERARMRRRARTIMAYTRSASVLLAVMPVIIMPLLCWMLEDYAHFMLQTPTGNLLLAISACLVVGGTLLMQRLSRLESSRAGVPR